MSRTKNFLYLLKANIGYTNSIVTVNKEMMANKMAGSTYSVVVVAMALIIAFPFHQLISTTLATPETK